MDWLSLGLFGLIIAVLLVFNRLTDAGSSLNCQVSWREALKKQRYKDR